MAPSKLPPRYRDALFQILHTCSLSLARARFLVSLSFSPQLQSAKEPELESREEKRKRKSLIRLKKRHAPFRCCKTRKSEKRKSSTATRLRKTKKLLSLSLFGRLLSCPGLLTMDTFLILLIIPHNYCSRAVKEFVRFPPFSLSFSLSRSHHPRQCLVHHHRRRDAPDGIEHRVPSRD